jgi:hypothetical protein
MKYLMVLSFVIFAAFVFAKGPSNGMINSSYMDTVPQKASAIKKEPATVHGEIMPQQIDEMDKYKKRMDKSPLDLGNGQTTNSGYTR